MFNEVSNELQNEFKKTFKKIPKKTDTYFEMEEGIPTAVIWSNKDKNYFEYRDGVWAWVAQKNL